MQAFADDVTSLLRGQDLSIMHAQAQQTLCKVETWGQHHGLKFSHLKTELVMFTHKRNWELPGNLIMGGQIIALKDTAKYLGITLDSRLTWKHHLENKLRSATISLAQSRRVVGKMWGLSPDKARWLYTAMIRPVLSYGSLVWVGALDRKETQTKLSKFQRMACLMITSAFPGTATAALEVATGLPPLDLFLKGEALKTAYRLKRDGHWDTTFTRRSTCRLRSHALICESELELIPELQMPGDSKTPELVWDLPCEIQIQGRGEALDLASNIAGRDIVCFTDGSVTDDGAGAGMAFYGFDPGGPTSIGLGKRVTVFQAEVHALTAATAYLLEAGLEGRSIDIFSDSQATIRALEQMIIKDTSVKRCHEKLTQLSTANQVKLHWVPAHMGVEGNEAADCEAKRGAATQIYGPEPLLPISLTACKEAVKEWTRELHQYRWNNMKTCRLSRENLPTVNGVGGILTSLSRQMLRLVLQVITGHGNLGKHNVITGRSSSGICPKCQEETETPDHHVGRCPAFYNLRVHHLQDQETTVRRVVAEGKINQLAQYLKRAGRLTDFS